MLLHFVLLFSVLLDVLLLLATTVEQMQVDVAAVDLAAHLERGLERAYQVDQLLVHQQA